MVDLFILIICASLLAYVIQTRTQRYETVKLGIKKDGQSAFLYVVLLVSVILFAALRTTYNDTSTYMYGYTLVDEENITLNTLFQPYGGFEFYQQLIKRFISTDPQALIAVTAIVINVLFISFISRNSKTFGTSIYLYLIGNYIFGMAGLKQALAMAISLFAIEKMLQKKYLSAGMWLLVAVAFHPYIICMAILPFLTNGIWSRKTIFTLIISFLLIANLESLMNFAGIIGKDYTLIELTGSTINPIRVLIESIPVIFITIFKKKLEDSDDKLLVLGANMNIIKFFFIAAGLFVNPIYFARIGTYFSSVSDVVTPIILIKCFKNVSNGSYYRLGYYTVFSMYFILDMTKLGNISIFYDIFNHISLFDLLK